MDRQEKLLTEKIGIINANFSFLAGKNETLETRVALVDSLKLLQEVFNFIQMHIYENKLEQLMGINLDWNTLST